jgi:hypothetical protein
MPKNTGFYQDILFFEKKFEGITAGNYSRYQRKGVMKLP